MVVRKKKKQKSIVPMVILLVLALACLAVVLVVFNKLGKDGGKISLKNQSYKVELGSDMSAVKMSELLNGSEDKVNAATIDVSAVDFKTAGNYQATITCDGNNYKLTVTVEDTIAPVITLKADTATASTGQSLTAESFISQVSDLGTCTTGVVSDINSTDPAGDMKDSIAFDAEGTYDVMVVAVDGSGNCGTANVKVTVTTPVDYLNSGATVTINPGTDFTEFPTATISYGNNPADVDENNRPNGCNYYKTKYGQYAADFIQPMSNYVFLTFDEGYEFGNTPAILDTLKEKNAKAVFFVTLPFVKENPDLVQRMIDEGHVVGNHTVNHPSAGLCSLSVADQISEIQTVHQYMLDNFNYEMYLFRFPTGAFSEQSLAIVQSLGYRSVFWSFAHHDWDTNNQPDVAESLANATKTLHGGEIFLLHGVSTTDTAMLADLIDNIRAAGFEPGYYAKTN